MTKRDELIALGGVGVKVKPRKHYFTPSDEDHDMCARCGLIFRNLTVHCINDEWPETDAQYIARLEAALEAPAAGDSEPVAWTTFNQLIDMGRHPRVAHSMWGERNGNINLPLYTAPPADAAMREAVIEECARELETSYPDHAWLNAACAAIRALTAPGATTKSDGGAKAGSSPILADKEDQRSDTHGMMPVGDNAANFGSTGVGPSDPSSTRSESPEYVIRKSGYFYRPKAQGYTSCICEAGRWTKEEADKYADDVEGVTVHLASEFPSSTPRSEVTVEELADWLFANLRPDTEPRQDARALLDQFEIRRK